MIEIVGVVSTVAIALFAGATFLVTLLLAWDNRALLKAGTEPEVIAYLGMDRRGSSLMNLVLENVGQGPACDVEYRIHASPEIFANHSIDMVVPGSTRKVRNILPQGGTVNLFLTSSFSMFKGKDGAKLAPFDVEVSYSNLRNTRKKPRSFALDISQFKNELIETPNEKKIVEGLTKVSKDLQGVKQELQHFRVALIDSIWIHGPRE